MLGINQMEEKTMNLAEYKGVFVFAQQVDNCINSIAFELIGKVNTLRKI